MEHQTKKITVTEENLEAIRLRLPADQAAHLKPGCLTWKQRYKTSEPWITMTAWPEEARAAAWQKGREASLWGDWRSSNPVMIQLPPTNPPGRTL